MKTNNDSIHSTVMGELERLATMASYLKIHYRNLMRELDDGTITSLDAELLGIEQLRNMREQLGSMLANVNEAMKKAGCFI